MSVVLTVVVIIAIVALLLLKSSVRLVQQYERGVCCASAGCSRPSANRACSC